MYTPFIKQITRNLSHFFTLLIFCYLGLILFYTYSVRAQSTTPPAPSDDAVNSVAKQLYCPVCENIPLDVCPTQACAEWRELIRQKLAAGWNQGQIKQYFVEQYGDRVLATPPPEGLNWLVYILPPVAILIGGFILFRAFNAWKNPTFETSGGIISPPNDNAYVARLEEELRRRK